MKSILRLALVLISNSLVATSVQEPAGNVSVLERKASYLLNATVGFLVQHQQMEWPGTSRLTTRRMVCFRMSVADKFSSYFCILLDSLIHIYFCFSEYISKPS